MKRIKISNYNKRQWRIASIITFLFLFLFQVFLNQYEVVPRSLPDEVGAIAAGAKLAGYDWSYVLSKANMYYGFGMGILFTPLFKLIEDPLLLYQALLAGGALLRTLPVFLCFRLVEDYNKELGILFASIASGIAVIGAPTRSTNIDNEPMLILLAWIIFYLLVRLQDAEKKQKLWKSILLALTLAYSATVHTRAYIYIVAVVCVCLIYAIATRKHLICYSPFIIGGSVGILFSNIFRNLVQQKIYTSKEYEAEVIVNTLSNVSNSVLGILKNGDTLSEKAAWFFGLIFSNLWIVFDYYYGIIIVVSIAIIVLELKYCIRRFQKCYVNIDSLIIPGMFAVLIFVISLAGLGVLWMLGVKDVIQGTEDLSRGYFYLRYIGNTFGIILFCGMLIIRNDMLKPWMYYVTLVIGLIACRCTIRNSLSVAVGNGYTRGDWFGYFAPLSFTGLEFGEVIDNLSYYLVPTAIAVIVFLLVCKMAGRKNIVGYILILGLLIYQYSYSVVKWDAVFSNGDSYYGAIDETYKMLNSEDNIFASVDTVYYVSQQFGPQFEVLFVLKDKKIVSDVPKKISENMIILTDDLSYFLRNNKISLKKFKAFQLDGNEIIVTNDTEKMKVLKESYKELDLD